MLTLNEWSEILIQKNMLKQCLTDQLSEKSLGLEIKSLALVLLLKIMEVLVLRSRVLVLTLTKRSWSWQQSLIYIAGYGRGLCESVCVSVTLCDSIKQTHAIITKSSPSALLHKFAPEVGIEGTVAPCRPSGYATVKIAYRYCLCMLYFANLPVDKIYYALSWKFEPIYVSFWNVPGDWDSGTPSRGTSVPQPGTSVPPAPLLSPHSCKQIDAYVSWQNKPHCMHKNVLPSCTYQWNEHSTKYQQSLEKSSSPEVKSTTTNFSRPAWITVS